MTDLEKKALSAIGYYAEYNKEAARLLWLAVLNARVRSSTNILGELENIQKMSDEIIAWKNAINPPVVAAAN